MSITLIDTFIQSWTKYRSSSDNFLRKTAIDYVEATQKADIIHFSESTMSMLMDKLQHFEETIQQLENSSSYLSVAEAANAASIGLNLFRGAWITFHKPIEIHNKKIGALFCWVPSSHIPTGKDCYYLLLLDTQANIAYTFTCNSPGEPWDFDTLMHTCPIGKCTREYDILSPCDFCKVTIVLWSQIFALSLVIAGQYLATKRYVEQETCILHRTVRHGNKTKKVPTKYTYKMIDANEMIISLPPSPSPALMKETRESWILIAQMEGDLEYREKQTKSFIRHYRHERYVNMKGKEQHFPHGISRKQPVRKSLDGRRVTTVKASNYEQQGESPQ